MLLSRGKRGSPANYATPLAGILGIAKNDIPSIALTKAEHLQFTNAWRQAIPYGTDMVAKFGQLAPEVIRSCAKRIYADYPGILSVLGLDKQ